MVLHKQSETIKSDFLPEEFHSRTTIAPPPQKATSLADAVDAYERQIVENALREADGVQTRAAEILGTTRRILKYRMEKLNIVGKAE